MIRAFLEPCLVGEATAIAILVAPMRNERLNNMLYAELRRVKKSQAMKHLNRWIDTVHSSNKSTEATEFSVKKTPSSLRITSPMTVYRPKRTWVMVSGTT